MRRLQCKTAAYSDYTPSEGMLRPDRSLVLRAMQASAGRFERHPVAGRGGMS